MRVKSLFVFSFVVLSGDCGNIYVYIHSLNLFNFKNFPGYGSMEEGKLLCCCNSLLLKYIFAPN